MSTEPIAIVGVSCRLPGGANDLDSFWDLVANGGEAWSPVPADRFNETAFHHPNANDPNGTSNHRGGHFIDGDVRDFDHAFFHLSPQQAAAMDPQQRILLELSYEALESAGWTREVYVGSRTAVYAAIFGTDYERNLCKDVLDLPVYQSVGTGAAILANRISYVFDLRGPSVTLDTGCSGGLVSLHYAVQSLRSGESNAALVAAANLQLMPDHYIGMANQHMVASTGRCYPFDVRGEGYGRGEGFVVVALKRLSDALRDHDPIRSVILNTGTNQDGYTASGITHPNHFAQADLIRETYARINLRPQDVVYVEAHGTGTVAGDQEELLAIDEVFTGLDRSLPLYVGSNKGSIGHTESTSGLASLLKACLMLEREVIPPVAGFANPKPGLALKRIKIPKERLSWPEIEGLIPRVSINSFGYGGSNAHAILGRAPRNFQEIPDSSLEEGQRLFVLSANSQASLKKMVQSLADWISKHPCVSLGNVSYTLCHRRSALAWRFSCVADKSTSLIENLRHGMRTMPSKASPVNKEVIFVFTGQGAQWLGMGRELLLSTSSLVFRDSIRVSRDILHELGATWDLEAELLRQGDSKDINTAELAQPITTAVQVALLALLRTLGVRPVAVIGHSSGEIAAAFAAGRLSQRAALGVAYHRGFMAAASKEKGLPRGAMLSVGLGETDTTLLLEGLERGKAVVACVNSPSSVTVSGDADAIDEVIQRILLRGDGTFHRKLLVDTAYHSHHMQAVADDYRKRLDTLDTATESIWQSIQHEEVTMVSSVTGQPCSVLNASYWVENLVSPVRFSDAVQTVARDHYERNGGHAIFLEIGPHSALSGPTRQCLSAQDVPKLEYSYLSALRRGTTAITSVLELLGRLFELGVKLSFDYVSALSPGFESSVVIPDMPSYPWDHSVKHWHESRLNREYRMRREPYHHLLGVRMTDSTSIEPRWRHMVGLGTLPWLADHVIDGLMIFPGAGYVCMASEAISQLALERFPEQVLETVAFRDISFLRGLVVPDAPQRLEVQLSFKHQPESSALSFVYSVTAYWDGKWHEHSTGYVEGILSDRTEPQSEVLVHIDHKPWTKGKLVSTEELYIEMAADGNTYGPAFTGIRSLEVDSDGSRSMAVVEVPDIASIMPSQHQARHILHPTTFDSMFHVGIPMIRRKHGPGSVMPVHIGELLVSANAAALSSPGSKLEVQAKLTASHFRTTEIDMTVTAGGLPVLSASAIESRSLSAHTRGVNGRLGTQGICYELEWKPDLDFLRADDIRKNGSLGDLVGHICFKTANLSALELEAGHGGLALPFLTAVSACGGTLSSYDFVDATSDHFDDARKRLIGYPVKYRVLNGSSSLETQAFTTNAYDVVLISSIRALAHASELVQAKGLVILVLEPSDESWRGALQKSSTGLDVQLTFVDAITGGLIIVARRIGTQASTSIPPVRIVTHSTREETPPWVMAIEAALSEKGGVVSRETINHSSSQTSTDTSTCILVIDDLIQPILSDPHSFQAANNLIQQKTQILWLSPASPVSMHQITGVSRTAHAENDDLRLTVLHVACDLIENPNSRLIEILLHCIRHVSDRDGLPHDEREFRIRDDSTVLCPRLHSSSRLNHAISLAGNEHVGCVEVKPQHFVEAARRLVLAPGLLDDSSSDDVTFVSDDLTPLADDAIEIKTQAFVLSSAEADPNLASTLCEYAGVIEHVGKNVQGFAAGEAVVALSLDGNVGANRLRLPYLHAIRQPDGLHPSVSAAILLPTMAAVHALHHLARVQAGDSILVHGALSDVGRAMVAVARSMGVSSIFATAANPEQAVVIAQQLDIATEAILISRPSPLRPRHDSILKLDVIVHAGDSKTPIPANVWASLKPSRCVIVIPGTSSYDMPMAKLPRNTAVHSCHITDVLRNNPDHTATLVKKASVSLSRFPLNGIDVPIYDIAQVTEALRLIKLGISERVVLHAGQGSLVRAAIKLGDDCKWTTVAATYVVAGGMGDLGRRLLMLMASRGAKHLVTLSRRVVDQEDYRMFKADLERVSPGCQLHCLIGDVTDESSVANAVAQIAALQLPPVRGVIQSAVFLQDRTLERMRFEDFRPVTLAKIEGTLNLERFFTTPHLDFFLMLSSTVVVTGASGQANYNAGNAVQDALSHDRRPGFMSLNIGWIEDAIHTSNDKTRLQGLWRTGLKPIHPDQLSRYFDYLLGAASSRAHLRQAIIGFDAESLLHTAAGNSNVQSALFCHVRAAPRASGETTTATGNVQSFQQIVEAGDRGTVIDFITTAIVDQLTTLISVDAAQLNERDGSILDLGIDSLVTIELRNWITRKFSSPLQSSEIMMDQPIRDLAQKVASRSALISADLSTVSSSDSKLPVNSGSATTQQSPGTDTPFKSPSSSVDSSDIQLPPIPLPRLEDTLQLFEESRRGVDTAEDQSATAQAVRALLEGPGADLYQQVQEAGPDVIAEDYECQVYLEHREPLPEQGPFTFIHPVDAPTHTQARRAAILTVAAIDFARRLANGAVPADTLHGQTLTTEGRGWLFYANRHPGINIDYMQRHSPSNSIAVLRRGHVFQLNLPRADLPLSVAEIHAAYEEILNASQDTQPNLCTLTADERDSWAQMRQDLEREPENAATLACIDKAAFVMCLDDESPACPSERYTQFLLNGKEYPFVNRWLDKTLQFAVTANGFSAETYEHTKLDGLDARALHSHVVHALRTLPLASEKGSTSPSCSIKQHSWKLTRSFLQRIEYVHTKCRSYGPLDHRLLEVAPLGLSALRGTRSPPNATAHLTVLLALYLIDGDIRPAWEKVSLGTFARGRVEWVQTVSTAARAFIVEAAAAGDAHNKKRARAVLDEATAQHSRTLANASRGRGAVGPLYALRGAARRRAHGNELPQLFQTRAWDATRRGGPGQEVKLGFMRFASDEGEDVEDDGSWDEAGFLVVGERGVYVHCNVQEKHARFAVSGKPAYVEKVCESLQRAAELMLGVLREREQ